MRALFAALALASALNACDDSGSTTHPDATTSDDVKIAPDSGHDAGFIDAEEPVDLGAPDTGVVDTSSFEPGAFVEVPEGRVTIGATFANAKTAIGMPTRMSTGSGTGTPRSYEWDLSSGARLVIWFADTDLSQGAVEDTDKVLWIAVEGNFSGKSGSGVGIGSTKQQARAAFGTADRSAPVTDPPGTVDAWYTRGLLAAYGSNDQVRTITVTRAYLRAPDALIDIPGGRVDFPPSINGGAIRGSTPDEVRTVLGEPDGQGTVSPAGTTLLAWSYAFVGIEVFFADVLGNDKAAFITLHTPYYGLTGGGVGIGSTRAELETYLSSAGFDAGRATSASPDLFCYVNNATQRGLAATFSSANPSLVTTLNVGFPASACR
ncbi:MAG: hypothetical protein HY791_11830 [Deltaproteobacteria bacterium]|nr:hypothetical protein [Deltaproteobacteria bacterium]